MTAKQAVTLCVLLLTGLLTAGCSTRTAPLPGASASNGVRPYIIVNGKRYLSGPYGNEADIKRVVSTIQSHSQAQQLSARGFNLPNSSPYAFISVYDFRFPDDCGAGHFRYYQSEGASILEYEDHTPGNHVVKIRDYLTGPGPFVGAGLWGALDSTSDSPLILLSGSADQGGMGLMSGAYQIGWVTTLSHKDQERLGQEYAAALSRAAACHSS